MITLTVNENSLVQGKSGRITGEIYFETDGQFFPEKGWSDFPLSLLGMWMNSFIECVAIDHYCSFKFYFTDGPYEVEFRSVSADEYAVDFCGKSEVISVKTTKSELAENLLNACRKIFSVSDKMNLSDDSVKNLKNIASILER